MSSAFSPAVQSLLDECFASGRYESQEQTLLEALHLLRDRDADLRRFKAELQTRIDRVERGEGIEIEDDEALRRFFDDVQARGQERCRAAEQRE